MKKKTKITLAFLTLFVLAGCNTTKRAPQDCWMNQAAETSLMKDFEKHAVMQCGLLTIVLLYLKKLKKS